MVEAKFIKGSLRRHILVMTFSSSVGLIALFMVDLVDIYFLSLLQNTSITAAVGFAGNVMMLTISVNIGLMITMGALVSRSIGARKILRARRAATNVYVFAFLLTSVVAAVLLIFLGPILDIMGAAGETKVQAMRYLYILLPSVPLFSLSMTASGALRGLGDARRAMMVTLIAAVVNAILDPIFIFGLGMEIRGAAVATLISRLVMVAVALYGALYIHRLYSPFRVRHFKNYLRRILDIAVPSVLTNIVTPIGTIYVVALIATYGDSAVAGVSIINRLAPVVFGVLFSLSGAVGPIFGQNLGAHNFKRISRTFIRSLQFSTIYTGLVALLLFGLQDYIVLAFRATGETADLIKFFCTWLALPFVFQAAQFVVNAGFNNLGKPVYATMFNFGKTFIGTIPFAYFGGLWFGVFGVLAGPSVGAAAFGILASGVLLRYIKNLEIKLGGRKATA
ncbi:MAG: MATE family efflux transporter [Proteobacteria bacterium]|nr:MATE family efflux transporter [Pseudomonadota bacterium]